MIKHNFKKLNISREGIEVTKGTYKITRPFLKVVRYGLYNSIQRFAISIPSNIALETSPSLDKHFKQYLKTTLGSDFKWETLLIIAHKVDYISVVAFAHLENKIQKIQNQIIKFINSLNQGSLVGRQIACPQNN
jgi:four helix bundle protein